MAQCNPSSNRVFDLPRTDRVIYGPDARVDVAGEATRIGLRRPLVIASSTLAASSTAVADIAAQSGAVDIVTGIPAHVPRHAVLEVAARFRQLDADGLISVGGGTSIDCAKAVALCVATGVTTPDALADYRIKYRHPGPAVVPPVEGVAPQHIAIPTTLSGAEFTGIAGITDPVRGAKDLYSADALCPRVVVLDAGLAALTPRALWLSSGIRAIDHIVEGVYSRRSTPVTDALLLDALSTLARDLPASAADPTDLDLRTNCQIAAWMAIMHLRNVSTGISHGLGHQLGALLGVPHGVTSCVLLPHAMDFNLRVTRGQQAKLAAALGVDTTGLSAVRAAPLAAARVRELVGSLGLPARLRDVGVERHHFDTLVTEAMQDMIVAGNPRPVSPNDAYALLEAAW